MRPYSRASSSWIWPAFILSALSAPLLILFYAGHAVGAAGDPKNAYRAWRMALVVGAKIIVLALWICWPLLAWSLAPDRISYDAALAGQGAALAGWTMILIAIVSVSGLKPFKHLLCIDWVNRDELAADAERAA